MDARQPGGQRDRAREAGEDRRHGGHGDRDGRGAPTDTERRQHPEVVRRPADLPVDRDGCGHDRRHAEHRSEDDEPHRQGVEGRAEGARELAHNRTGERLARLVDRRRAREAVDERRRVGARDDTDHAADPERREVGMRVGERGRQVGRGERRLVTAPDLEELADDADHLDLGHLVVATADGLTGLVVHEEGSVGDVVAHADPEPPSVLLGDDRLASGAGVGEPSPDQARLRRGERWVGYRIADLEVARRIVVTRDPGGLQTELAEAGHGFHLRPTRDLLERLLVGREQEQVRRCARGEQTLVGRRGPAGTGPGGERAAPEGHQECEEDEATRQPPPDTPCPVTPCPHARPPSPIRPR